MPRLKDCQTASEVFANYREVKNRIKNWKPKPKPIPITILSDDGAVSVRRPSKDRPPTPQLLAVIHAVCREYKVSVIDILSNRRMAYIVFPRQVAMTLAKRVTLKSLPEIGRRFGGRDHTTVLHAIRKIEKMRGEDVQLDATMARLESELGGEHVTMG